MKRFVLDHLSKACATTAHIRACDKNERGSDLSIHLDDGRTIAVYVLNRAIRVPEIRETLEDNTAKRIHTLFIVDGRMMPAENEEIEPPHWMTTLHALAHGRIYAYWCDQRRVTIRPVHMDWKWGGSPRGVEYGPVIDLKNLRATRVECATATITGNYAIADFNDAQFWKKRDPAGEREFKYSWRNWSYSTKTKEQQEKERAQREEQDAWENFAHAYGRANADGSSSQYDNYRKQRRKQRRSWEETQTAFMALQRDYAILGVPQTATFDEVKRAYRQKAREYHPDMHPPHEKDKYNAKMADINAAFEAISKQIK